VKEFETDGANRTPLDALPNAEVFYIDRSLRRAGSAYWR
jgi:hypothetical protein